MQILEKVKSFLLYDGLSKEEYSLVESYIAKENNHRLKIYNIVGLLFVLSLLIASVVKTGFSTKTFIYLGGCFCNLLEIIILYSKSQIKNNIVVSKILNYFFSSLMLLFTIYIGSIQNAQLPAACFLAALAIIPYITYNKVIFSFIQRVIILLIFFYVSSKTKAPEYLRVDIINGISIFFLSTLAGVRVQQIQVKAWVMTNSMDKELKQMSGVFENIRVIDLSTNSSIDYSTNPEFEKRVISSDKNASAQMDTFLNLCVKQDNKVHMTQFCDLSTLEDRLYSKKMLVCDFATTDGCWSRATFVPIELDKKGFVTKVVFTIQRIADSFYLGMLDFDLKKIK